MPLKINKNFALLYGIMLGDGCLSLFHGRKKYLSIAGSLADDKPFFENIIQPIIKKMVDKEIPIKLKPYCGSLELNFVHYKLFDFVQSFGFPIGKKGNRLFIPQIFYDKKLVKYLIRGFFATDGSLVLTDNNGILYPRVEANGIAKSLIQEINTFLNNKGINCKLYLAKRTNSFRMGCQEQYRLQMNGKDNLKKFVKTIGFVNPKQIERLGEYYNYVKEYGCTED